MGFVVLLKVRSSLGDGNAQYIYGKFVLIIVSRSKSFENEFFIDVNNCRKVFKVSCVVNASLSLNFCSSLETFHPPNEQVNFPFSTFRLGLDFFILAFSYSPNLVSLISEFCYIPRGYPIV